MKNLLRYLLLSFAIGMFTIYCSESPPEEPEVLNYTEETVDGVRYIHNLYPKFKTSPISLEFVRKWGELESPDENYNLFQPGDIDIDSKGDVYIADRGNHRVQKFDSSGKYLLTMGRRGQGPGEFTNPGSTFIDKIDNIYVYATSSFINIFDTNGEFTKLINTNGVKGSVWSRLSTGELISRTGLSRQMGNLLKGTANLAEIWDENDNVIANIVKPRKYEDFWMKLRGNRINLLQDNNNDFYIWFLNQNRIEKYDPSGKIIFKMDRILTYEESEAFTKEYPAKITNPNADRDAFRMVFNKFTFFAGVDLKNRLWLGTYSRQTTKEERDNLDDNNVKIDNRMFEIYDSSGILLYRINPEFDIDSDNLQYKLIGDRLFAIDPWKNMAVYEYKIM